MGEQSNLYKLQSYYIYKAQTEAEPWGTQDGNNLQSRFAWSYAAFERSDTRWQHEERDRQGRGATPVCQVPPLLPTPPSVVPAPTRVRFIPKGTRVKLILVLSRAGSP